MPSRRLLVVVYPYPPIPSVGANRWSAAAKHLRRLGHEVTVVTTSAYGSMPGDDADAVVRTRDLNSARLLRRVLRRPPLAVQGGELPSTEAAAPWLLTRVLVPDAFLLSWVPTALQAARRIVSERRIDCVITSSPFESTHLVGLGLGRHRPAWLADFRDGWSFEPLRPPFPTATQRALDQRLEGAVVEHADAVIAVTPPIADDLSRRFGVETAHVPNGWDPDLEPAVAATALPVKLTPGRLGIVHTGGFARGDPRPFFEALAQLSTAEPDLASRLEVILAGRLKPSERGLIERPELKGLVRHVGMLPRVQALALQRRADALLLVTSEQRSEATGKIFEYLAAGRPILALANGNAAAGIVKETGTGLTVPPADVGAITDALRLTLEGGLTVERRSWERYRFPEIAEALADQVERAIERRTRRLR